MSNAAIRELQPRSAEHFIAEILTTTEVARELRCSKAHIHNLINGKVHGAVPLPTITLGRRRLIRRSTLIQWMASIENSAS